MKVNDFYKNVGSEKTYEVLKKCWSIQLDYILHLLTHCSLKLDNLDPRVTEKKVKKIYICTFYSTSVPSSEQQIEFPVWCFSANYLGLFRKLRIRSSTTQASLSALHRTTVRSLDRRAVKLETESILHSKTVWHCTVHRNRENSNYWNLSKIARGHERPWTALFNLPSSIFHIHSRWELFHTRVAGHIFHLKAQFIITFALLSDDGDTGQ